VTTGGSILLIVVGAILRFAVRLRSSFAGTTVNWHLVGDILMLAGLAGFVISVIWLVTAGRRDRVAVDGPPANPPPMP
jgi:hypothetical protein